MAITLGAFTLSAVTIGTTEWSITNNSSTLANQTTVAQYQVTLDLSNLALGDSFEFRIYEKVLSGGTRRCMACWPFTNAQGADNANWVSPALMLGNGFDFSLKKLAGTDRVIDASVNKAA
ncbi:MAG: hypothetical protein ABJA10_07600 [Aestuariivirga sp.]